MNTRRFSQYLLTAAIFAVVFPASADAQQLTEKRVELGVGARFATAFKFNDVDADEIAFGGSNRPLFHSSSRLQAAPGGELRIGVRMTPRVEVEGAVGFVRTRLSTAITADREASNISITEALTQYMLQIGVLRHVASWRGGRAVPFLGVGAGYLRQLHDGHTLVEGAPIYYVGGGVDYRFSGGGSRLAGLRVDVRETFLTGGVTLDDEIHPVPVIGAALFFRF